MSNFTKLLLVCLVFCLFLFSCGNAERIMGKSLDKVFIGMTMSQFKSEIRGSTMIYLSEEYSCFKISKTKATFGVPGGFTESTRFFYFKGDKLWKIDEGQRAVDYRIKID